MTPIGHTVPPLVTPRGTKRPNKLFKGILAGFGILVLLVVFSAYLYLLIKGHTQQNEKTIAGGQSSTAPPDPASSPLNEAARTSHASAVPPPTAPPESNPADPPPPPPPHDWSPQPPIGSGKSDFTPNFTPEPVAKPKTRAQLVQEDLERMMKSPMVPGTPPNPRQSETDGVKATPISGTAPINYDLEKQLIHPSQIQPDAYERQNNQDGKEAFYRNDPEHSRGHGPAIHHLAEGTCTIRAGWSIPAELLTAINSDLPGMVRARVRRNVYDTDTGQCLAIPQGSFLVGEYNSRLGIGQDRLQTKWTTLLCPHEDPILLAGMSGNAPDGSAGMKGDMNHHYRKLIGFTLLASAFTAGIQISQSRGQSTGPYGYPTVGQAAANGIATEAGQAGRALIERAANQQPTYTAPAGTLFELVSTADLVFSGAYRGHE